MKSRILRFITLRKYRITLILLDIIFVNLSVCLSISLLGKSHPGSLFYLSATLIWFITASLFLLYSVSRYAIRQIILSVIAAWVVLNLATFYIDVLKIARGSLLFVFPFMMIFILGHRLLLRRIRSSRTNKEGGCQIRVLILGVGEEAKEIAEGIKSNEAVNYKVIGFLNPESQHRQDIKVDKQLILGTMDSLYKVVKKEKIDEVIIAFPVYTSLLHKKIERIMREHSELAVNFKVSPYLYDALVGRLKMSYISEIFLLDILPGADSRRYLVYKRLIDVVISLLGLIVLSPIMLLISLILKFHERGSVFYRQERLGESGQPFMLCKFRSMVPDAEKHTGPVWTRKDDSRITSFGRFLRRNSLDELPQLWNVLKGDMSLVGPRPERPHFIDQHKELRGRRLNVKPGITGLAQVNGRYNLTARHKAKYDYIYLKNCSFPLDIKILFQTLWVVLSQHGAR